MDKEIQEHFKKERLENIKAFHLIAGFVRNTLTDEERNQLDEWITKDDFNEVLFDVLSDPDYAAELSDIAKALESKATVFSPTLDQLESFVTVMSQAQYKRLELISQGKQQTSSFTDKEVKALEKKINKLRERNK